MYCLAIVAFELYEFSAVLLVDPLELLGFAHFLTLDLYITLAVSDALDGLWRDFLITAWTF